MVYWLALCTLNPAIRVQISVEPYTLSCLQCAVRFPGNADSSPLGLSSAQTRTEAIQKVKHCLPVGEYNPGLPLDRRGSAPVSERRRVCLPLASLADACCCQFCCSIQKTSEETQNEHRHIARSSGTYLTSLPFCSWFHGVMVSTLDSESSD